MVELAAVDEVSSALLPTLQSEQTVLVDLEDIDEAQEPDLSMLITQAITEEEARHDRLLKLCQSVDDALLSSLKQVRFF